MFSLNLRQSAEYMSPVTTHVWFRSMEFSKRNPLYILGYQSAIFGNHTREDIHLVSDILYACLLVYPGLNNWVPSIQYIYSRVSCVDIYVKGMYTGTHMPGHTCRSNRHHFIPQQCCKISPFQDVVTGNSVFYHLTQESTDAIPDFIQPASVSHTTSATFPQIMNYSI